MLGISCPKAEVTLRSGTRQEADPCGNEALKFTKEKVIQRDVSITYFITFCVQLI